MREDFNTWMMFFLENFDRVISYRLVNLSNDFDFSYIQKVQAMLIKDV